MSQEENTKECCGGNCGHNHAHPSVEEIAYNNHFMINTLISLLVDEKVISKEALETKIQKVQEEQLKAYEEAQKEASQSETPKKDD